MMEGSSLNLRVREGVAKNFEIQGACCVLPGIRGMFRVHPKTAHGLCTGIPQ